MEKKCALKINGCDIYNRDKNFQECQKCILGLYFFKNNRTYYYNNLNTTQYYTKDNGVSYYPCTDDEEHCDTCNDEFTCKNCISAYALVRPDLCVNKILNCEVYNETTNFTNCSKCNETFYFIKDDRKNCRNDIDKEKYFSEDNGISFYPCNEAITNYSNTISYSTIFNI